MSPVINNEGYVVKCTGTESTSPVINNRKETAPDASSILEILTSVRLCLDCNIDIATRIVSLITGRQEELREDYEISSLFDAASYLQGKECELSNILAEIGRRLGIQV